MTVEYEQSFYDDFENIVDKHIIRRAYSAIKKLKSASSLREVTNIIPMKGAPGFFRIRFGEYRIGFQVIEDNTVVLLAINRRSVFYRYFPSKFQ